MISRKIHPPKVIPSDEVVKYDHGRYPDHYDHAEYCREVNRRLKNFIPEVMVREFDDLRRFLKPGDSHTDIMFMEKLIRRRYEADDVYNSQK